MRNLYEFSCNYGRIGSLEGIFIAEEKDVKDLIGKTVHFGEVLGKHSEVSIEIEDDDIKLKSDDQDFITKLQEVFEYSTLSGYNPFDYLDEDDEEDCDDDEDEVDDNEVDDTE